MSDTPDPRNVLNDLSNRQWLKETKSFWQSRADGAEGCEDELVGEFVQWLRETREPEEVARLLEQLDESFVYSKAPPRSKLKSLHPATFSEADIERLIRLFTKQGETVLDPFVGSGSALIACAKAGRRGVGVELSAQWADVARRRIEEETAVLGAESTQCFDFVVTSPPYWSILTRKAGMKAKAERVKKGLPTQYSENEGDLGNIESYEGFLSELAKVFAQCSRVLKPKRYMALRSRRADRGGRYCAQGRHDPRPGQQESVSLRRDAALRLEHPPPVHPRVPETRRLAQAAMTGRHWSPRSGTSASSSLRR